MLLKSISMALLATSLLSVAASTGAFAKDDEPSTPPPRPVEADVHFQESDFSAKPWMREFQWVVVVNRANKGADKQSIRVYHEQSLIQYGEVKTYLESLDGLQEMTKTKDPNRKDRKERIDELAGKQWSPGVFKVSTGRNGYEPKGEHHSRHDSWSTTPTGFYVPQAFVQKHKSESYSNKLCESLAGKLLGAVLRKKMCTYMENVTFFNGGIGLHKAIPGTEPVLGTKASGGCVRLPAALAEYLFHNFDEAKGDAVPVVNLDGTVKLDASGAIVREKTHKGDWGKLAARSVLIIVQDQP